MSQKNNRENTPFFTLQFLDLLREFKVLEEMETLYGIKQKMKDQ